MTPQKNFDISELTKGLYYESGIWYSGSKEQISYPADGNESLFDLEDNSYWFRHRNQIILELVNIFSKEKTFIDAGGGNGYVAKELADNGYVACLVEPGIEGIKNARKRGLTKLINASFKDAGFKISTLDNIGLFDVLEHIDDHEDFLTIIWQTLKENGLLFISVPASKLLWSRDDVFAGHYRRYTLKSLTEILKSNGFSVIYSTYFFSFLFPLIFFFKSLPSLIPFLKRNENFKSNHISSIRSINSMIDFFCSQELSVIRKRHKIILGSSCFIVAQKV